VKKYERLAASMIGLIENGIYGKSDRLPSLRDFATSFKVSLNTARAVYEYLERERYVTAHPQSGFYVADRVIADSPSTEDPSILDPREVGLLRIATAMAATGESRPESVDLGLSYLSRDLIPADLLRQFTDAALRLHTNIAVPLLSSPGYGPLRRQIAMHSVSTGTPIDTEDILMTSGCQESIYLALLAVSPSGSSVAVESPVSFPLHRVILGLRLNPVEIPIAREGGMSLEALEFALDHYPISSVITNGNFHNPTGDLMPTSKKMELTGLLASRGIPLIEDDPSGDLYFASGTTRPSTCISLDRGDNVIYCSSFSKTVAPNLRLGWIVSRRWRDQIEQLIQLANHGMSTIPQIAMALLLEDGFLPRHLRKTRVALRSRVPAAREAILSAFPAGTRVSDPSGGVSLWVTLPEGRSSQDLYKRALAAGILVAPGFLFGESSRHETSFRLNGSVLTAKDAATLGALATEIEPTPAAKLADQ